MNVTLTDQAIAAIHDPAFTAQRHRCEQFAREVIQRALGQRYDDIFAGTARQTAFNWANAGFGFPPSHFGGYLPGDLLYKTQNDGPDGHVGIYVGAVEGIGDLLVAENSSTSLGRLCGAKGYRTLRQWGQVDVQVRLPDPEPSWTILLGETPIADGIEQDGHVLCPVRAWGQALGFTVTWSNDQVRFDRDPRAVTMTQSGGHAYAPILDLARDAGLIAIPDEAKRQITVERA